jgi:hypothetical protein
MRRFRTPVIAAALAAALAATGGYCVIQKDAMPPTPPAPPAGPPIDTLPPAPGAVWLG